MGSPSLQAQLDSAARQKGFKNYEQWSAWNAHQQQMMQGPAPTAAPVAVQPQPQQPPRNWFQQLIDDYTPLGSAMKKVRSVL